MNPFLRAAGRIVLPVILLGLVPALYAVNLEYVSRAPARDDFGPRWQGGRAWITGGTSPYDPAVSLAAQESAYGRPANAQRQEDPLHFLYPFPAIIVYGPLGALGEGPAQALWMSVLEVCLFAAAWMWARAAGWSPTAGMTAAYLTFAVLWYPAFATLVSAQFVAVEALLLAGAVAAIRSQRDALGGLLLSASLIKPQVGLALVVYAAIWSFASGRRALLGWLLTGVAVLLGASLLIEPGWPGDVARQVFDYLELPVSLSPVGRLSAWMGTGRIGTWILTGAFLVYLIWEWKESVPGEGRRFLWTAALTQAVALLIIPFGTMPNLILLVFPIAVTLEAWYARQGSAIDAPAAILFIVIAGFTWLSSLRHLEEGEPSLAMLIGLPLAAMIGLFWVRWWSYRGRDVAELGARAR